MRKETPGLASLVDPFLGNSATDLPARTGIAAAWFWPKAQMGNTHPGACLPFGMVTACAYSGAYTSGYGLYSRCYDGLPDQVFGEYTATGFTHFHHSGTGDIGAFYNYLRVIPVSRKDEGVQTRWTLAEETARPGYYAATLKESGVRCELTVGRRGAVHRYTFPRAMGASIAIDLSQGGIRPERHTVPTAPTPVSARRKSPGK